jgi:hypothetical protein
MKPKIPRPLKLEHAELHAELVGATKSGGKTGEAAKAVAKVLHNHFVVTIQIGCFLLPTTVPRISSA